MGPDGHGEPLTTVYRPRRPVDVARTLGSLRRGGGDPSHRVRADGVWRTAATPAGPGTLLLTSSVRGPVGPAGPVGEVRAAAWGPGAGWLLEHVPDLLGARDPLEEFAPALPLLRELARRYPGMRTPRTGLVFEMLAAAVLEQKVTGNAARRSWRELVTRFGTPAPGPAPAGMWVAPPAEAWRRIPSWEWHRAGVDGARSRTVLAAARVASALERTLAGAGVGAEVERVLRAVPGVGVWTAAEVAQRAHGDADAVSVGDLHVPGLVGWNLAGRLVDDDGMLELLAPYTPHRYRVQRLLETGGRWPPRRAPRMAVQDMRAF